jgi:hypothetical protein
LQCDDSYEAHIVCENILIHYFDIPELDVHGSVMYNDMTQDMAENIWSAVVKSPNRFIRDILDDEYHLPLLRRNMTDEQKHIADVLEARFKQDVHLRLEGKQYCHFTGVISVITDEQRERNKRAERLPQAEINAGLHKKALRP